MEVEKKKLYHSCFCCKHLKALTKNTVPCYHCHQQSKWQHRTEAQEKRDRAAETKHVAVTVVEEANVSSEVQEAFVNKSE